MLFGCHKETQLHQKLAASDINNNNNTTITNDGNINDIYVTQEKLLRPALNQ